MVRKTMVLELLVGQGQGLVQLVEQGLVLELNDNEKYIFHSNVYTKQHIQVLK